MDAAVLGIQRVVLGHRGRDVDSGAGQGLGCLLRCQPVDLGGDDGAADAAEVVDGDAGQPSQLPAEPGAQRGGPLPDRLQAHVEGLPDGGAQAQDVHVAVLPGGEPAGAGRPGKALLPVPGRRADLGHERVEPVQRGGAHPQEARAPRAAQELAAGAGQQVAADRVRGHRELADRLGGIQQEQRSAGAGDPPDLGGGLDQAATGGHVADPDQPGPRAGQPFQRGHVQLAVLVVGHHHDLGAGPAGGLPVGQHVAAVLGPAGQDLVTRAQRHRVERRVPGVGGVVEQRDLLGPAADHLGDRLIGDGDRGPRLGGGLVPADLRLPAQVRGHRVQCRLRHERRAGVVEVNPPGTAGCLRPQCVDVHPHADPSWSRRTARGGPSRLPGPAGRTRPKRSHRK